VAKPDTPAVVCNTTAVAAMPSAATLPAMTRTPFEELVHRVNNLLGTIEIQAEVAQATGTTEACLDALRRIVESARKTQDDVRRLREVGKERG
jgi:hypothetical protein